jgi:hypothetical protein
MQSARITTPWLVFRILFAVAILGAGISNHLHNIVILTANGTGGPDVWWNMSKTVATLCALATPAVYVWAVGVEKQLSGSRIAVLGLLVWYGMMYCVLRTTMTVLHCDPSSYTACSQGGNELSGLGVFVLFLLSVALIWATVKPESPRRVKLLLILVFCTFLALF